MYISTSKLILIAVWMNILHAVTAAKKDTSPQIIKLKSSCSKGAECPVTIPKADLKERLSPLQYRVTQEQGTERAFSGKYVSNKEEGVYTCIVCGNQLFSSDAKYDSKSGWPSFFDVVNKKQIMVKEDTSHGMKRLEVTCSNCGAHLGHVFDDGPLPTGMQRIEAKCSDCHAHIGHVFDDGPKPTGLRYCVNSAALDFKKHSTGQKLAGRDEAKGLYCGIIINFVKKCETS